MVTVKDRDSAKVGRRFSNAATELYLAGYAGFHTTAPPGDASEFGVYWPALVPADVVSQRLTLSDGSNRIIPHTPPSASPVRNQAEHASVRDEDFDFDPPGETVRAPLGLVCGARSGDKGGNANVGLWTRTPAEFAWLRDYLTTGKFRELLTEAADLPVHRHELANLLAVNFVITGLLGNGVADATRPDPQAKGLGEYIRSRHVDLPAQFVREGRRP